MARVLLLTTTPPEEETPEHLAALHGLRHAAEVDRVRAHSLTSNPHEANIILFAESYGGGWHFERVRRHPYTRRFREKCFLFCGNPFVIPFLPGIYTGINRRWASRRTAPGFYVGLPENPFITLTPPSDDLPYLYSFVGSFRTAAVRQRIAALAHPRGYIRDSATDYDRALHGTMSPDESRDYRRNYAEVIRASKFVLCPRGLSVSTIRVFEAMEMGRVPVILSDGWMAPPGPAWSEFSIRIAERRAQDIPRILAERENEAVAMGERARREWMEWFAPDVLFHRAVEYCLAIQRQRRIPESVARWAVYAQYLRPFHFRRLLRRKFEPLRVRRPR